MYRRIVVPLDGSEFAERALPEAEGLARLTGAPVHLLRVIDVLEFEMTRETAAAGSYLKSIAERLCVSGLVAETEVRHGQTSRELNAATRLGDVIVMASHGRGGVARWFLGSVAEDMVRRATVPIMLVRTDTAMDTPVATDATSQANGDSTREGTMAPDATVVRSRALRLLDKDLYTPEEASYLLGIPKGAIFQAAFAKRLTAEIIGHNVISIRRDDLLAWLDGNDHPGSPVGPTGYEPAAVE